MTRPLTPYNEKCFAVVTTLRRIVSRREWHDFVFSSKKCYSALLRENSTSPILHRFWSSFLPIDFDLDLFWDYVRDGCSENYKNDILWLIVLRAVKVRDSLKNWGYIDSNKCASCSRKETIDHCFLNCVRVKRVWSFFSPVLSSLLGNVFLPSCTRVFFEGMIRYILSDIKNRVACDYYRLTFSDFKNCWEAPGLCRLNGDSYKLLL